MCAWYHDLGGDRRSVGRLLTGAYRCGWVEKERYQEQRRRLSALEGYSSDEAESAQRAHPDCEAEPLSAHLAASRNRLSECRWVIADDRLEASGLNVFWKALLESCPGAELLTFSRASDFEAYMRGGGLRPSDALVIDLDFGVEGRDRGIQLVKRLRESREGRYLALPVVAFTGSGDPYLSEAAHRAGSDFVFVKETSVVEADRDVRYFTALVAVLDECARLSSLTQAWMRECDVREAFDLTATEAVGDRDLTRHHVVPGCLARAFCHVAYGPRDPKLAAMALGERGCFSSSLVQSVLAIEAMVEAVALAALRSVDRTVDLREVTLSDLIRLIVDNEAWELAVREKDRLYRLRKLRNSAVHPGARGSEVDEPAAREALDLALDLAFDFHHRLERWAGASRPKPAGGPAPA